MNTIEKIITAFGVIALFIALFTIDWDLGIVDIVALLAVVTGKQLPYGNIIKITGEIIVVLVSAIIVVLALLILWAVVVL